MKISACIITYNQELYIKDCLEGALSQNLTCEYEIVIGEDFSSDNTLKICKEYAIKYPNIIKLLPSVQNHGMIANWERTILACQGEYIAICEGDDYWTDRFKLQKQADVMDKNGDYIFCFHNAETLFCNTGLIKPFNQKIKSKAFSTNSLLFKGWFIPTASLFIRKIHFPEALPKWYYSVASADYALELLLSTKGPFYYIDEKMSVYRKNAVNSSSLNGTRANQIVNSRLLLLKNFQKSNGNKNAIAANFAIAKAKLDLLKVYIYHLFPFVSRLKDKILH